MQQIIARYYESFNNGDMVAFLDLLAKDVVHDINQGGVEVGQQAFAKFMTEMNRYYKEQVSDLIILVDSSGKHGAAKFVVSGEYIKTQPGLPEARGQKYKLECGAFFEVAHGKITKLTNYYNLNEWLKQITN